jgi:hypothetical protein
MTTYQIFQKVAALNGTLTRDAHARSLCSSSAVTVQVQSRDAEQWLSAVLEDDTAFQASLLSTRDGMVLKQIEVLGNQWVQLHIEADILWNNAEESAPQLSIALSSIAAVKDGRPAWRVLLPNRITRSHSAVEATVYIPADVRLMQIELLVESTGHLRTPYQLDLPMMRCSLVEMAAMPAQWSVALPRPKSIAGVQTIARSGNLLDRLADHTYLLHLPSTPIHQLLLLKRYLEDNRFRHQLMYSPTTTTTAEAPIDLALPHEPHDCERCFMHSPEYRGALQNASPSRADEEALSDDATAFIDLFIAACRHALHDRRESIIVLRDDIVGRRNPLNHISSHLDAMPAGWRAILFGANHLIDDGAAEADTPAHSRNSTMTATPHLFYPVSEQSLYSCFALAFNGTDTIRMVLHYFVTAQATQMNPLVSLNIFLTETWPQQCHVWFPNLFVLHPDLSVQHVVFSRSHQHALGNCRGDHKLYWEREEFVLPAALGSTLTEGGGARRVHLLLCLSLTTKVSLVALQTIYRALSNQTYGDWRLHVLYTSHAHSRVVHEAFRAYPQQVVLHAHESISSWVDALGAVLDRLDDNDWVAFQPLHLLSMPTRLDTLISAWLSDARGGTGAPQQTMRSPRTDLLAHPTKPIISSTPSPPTSRRLIPYHPRVSHKPTATLTTVIPVLVSELLITSYTSPRVRTTCALSQADGWGVLGSALGVSVELRRIRDMTVVENPALLVQQLLENAVRVFTVPKVLLAVY